MKMFVYVKMCNYKIIPQILNMRCSDSRILMLFTIIGNIEGMREQKCDFILIFY